MVCELCSQVTGSNSPSIQVEKNRRAELLYQFETVRMALECFLIIEKIMCCFLFIYLAVVFKLDCELSEFYECTSCQLFVSMEYECF